MMQSLTPNLFVRIDLKKLTFTILNVRENKEIRMSPLNENMTLKELDIYIEKQKETLKGEK